MEYAIYVLTVVVIAAIAAAAVSIFMRQNSMYATHNLVKQIAIWLGIVTLLPLAVWYGTNVFSPPPDRKQHSKSTSRIHDKIREVTDAAEKEKLRQEEDKLDTELEEAEHVYYRKMFWVAYPVGLVAIVIGTFLPVQAVGAGLMFGGLISLAAGCYSYWDAMEGWLRFGSLLVALVVLLVLGTWRFRPTASTS